MGLLYRLGRLPQPVRLVGVTVSGLAPADLVQVSLFGEEELNARVDQVVDAINERFGEGTVRQAREGDPADPASG
jgi:hypothetical protein